MKNYSEHSVSPFHYISLKAMLVQELIYDEYLLNLMIGRGIISQYYFFLLLSCYVDYCLGFMMWKMSRYRIIYIIAVVICILAAIFLKNDIVIDNTKFNILSYIVSVLTIVALVITVGEILHNSYFTKTVYELTNEHINEFKKITSIEFKVECLDCYISISENIDDESYMNAYLLFKHAKKIDDYLYSNHADKENKSYVGYSRNLLKIEKEIFASRKAKKGKGLNPSQRQQLINRISSHRTLLSSLIV